MPQPSPLRTALNHRRARRIPYISPRGSAIPGTPQWRAAVEAALAATESGTATADDRDTLRRAYRVTWSAHHWDTDSTVGSWLTTAICIAILVWAAARHLVVPQLALVVGVVGLVAFVWGLLAFLVEADRTRDAALKHTGAGLLQRITVAVHART